MSNLFYPRCSQPLPSPVQTITPSFIPLFQLAITILTIPSPRVGVPRTPPAAELFTNGELLMSGLWEQLWNSSAELSPRLCLLSFLTRVTEIFPKIRSLHFSLLLRACGSARAENGSALTEFVLYKSVGCSFLSSCSGCTELGCFVFGSVEKFVILWFIFLPCACNFPSLWKRHHPTLKNTHRTVLRLENWLEQREFL